MIVILTLANKPQYLPDAVASVEAQTRRDFVHTVALDDENAEWGGRYPPGVFFNHAAKLVHPHDYICWLSDDDLLLPNYLEDLAGFLDANREIGCCYGGSEVIFLEEDGSTSHYKNLPELGWPTYNKWIQPACQIDGGMIMLRRSVLDLIETPWMNELADPELARITDGHLMNKIANKVGIYPVKKQVMINRITPVSAHCQSGGGVRHVVDWRGSEKWTE
jgi:hypothetical protein